MSDARESLADKQRRLAADIARQRSQFAQAYRDIERPVHYGEQALRGLGFIRQNAWIFTAVPATLSITTTIINLLRNKPAKASSKRGKWFARDAEREVRRESKSLAGHFLKWGGHGWRLFRLYRRVRKFFP